MTTYNSYEEAKIANPDQDIYLDESVFRTWRHDQIKSGSICDPAKYCKTLGWLRNNHGAEFAGDIIIGHSSGKVIEITQDKIKDYDDNCLILRAAALEEEEQEPQWDGVTMVGGNEEKPKRVKYDFERVDFVEHWEYFKLMSEEGDLYVHCTDLGYEGFDGDNINLANALHDGSCIYRRIETEITERDEFIQEAMKHGANKGSLELGELRLVEKMFDSGRYKLVEGE